MSLLGKHIFAEFYGCSFDILNNLSFLEEHLVNAAKISKATVLDSVSYKFDPQGITAVLLLAESHISIHTYPELNFAAVDIFTCGNIADPELGLNYLAEKLCCSDFDWQIMLRGSYKKAEENKR